MWGFTLPVKTVRIQSNSVRKRTSLSVNFNKDQKPDKMDNKTQKDVRDRTRVNINEQYEVEYWSKKFNVTPQELRDAVRETGSESVKEIEEFLRNHTRR